MTFEHIAGNLAAVRARIAAAAESAGRSAGEVTLVAVGKTHPAAAIEAALAAGQRVFGENRVQEAQRKYPALKTRFPDLVLHLIGPLQSNKVRDAVALFDVIETVDRPRLAEALAAEMKRGGRRPDCFVQVNTGEEAQKAGITPREAVAFVAINRPQKACHTGADLRARGRAKVERPADPIFHLDEVKHCGQSY